MRLSWCYQYPPDYRVHDVHIASVGLIRHQPVHTSLHWCGRSSHCQLLMEHTADVQNIAADAGTVIVGGRGGHLYSEDKQ